MLVIPRLWWSGVSAVGSGTRIDGLCLAVSGQGSRTPWRLDGLMHCPVSNAEGSEEQRAIRPAKRDKSVPKPQKPTGSGALKAGWGPKAAWVRALDVVCRGYLGYTALMEWGVRVKDDESGALLRERHRSPVHCEKRCSKVLLALPTAAPDVPG